MNETTSDPEEIGERLLKDKVALLIDGASNRSGPLALSLAQLGAHVAIGYREDDAESVFDTKKQVEAEGRRCLLVSIQEGNANFAKEIILRTKNSLGRFDIFIDLSLQSGELFSRSAFGDVQMRREAASGSFPDAKIAILSAVLDQIIEPADLIDSRVTPDKQNRDDKPYGLG